MGRFQTVRLTFTGLKVIYWAFTEGPGHVPALLACVYSLTGVSFSITLGWQAYFNPWIYLTLLFLYLTYKNRRNYWKKNREQIMHRLKGEQYDDSDTIIAKIWGEYK